MPQDTTIYWDGYDVVPAPIDSLPTAKKIQVLQVIEKRKEELSYSNPVWIYVSLLAFILFFGGAAVYGNIRNKKKYPTLTKKVRSGVK